MYEVVETFLADLSEEFLAGDVDAVMKRMSIPSAIYFGSDVIVVQSRKQLEDITKMYLDGLREGGLSKTKPVLTDLKGPKNNGVMTASTLSYLVNSEGVRVGLSRAKYFLRETASGLKIEMAEHSQAPLGNGLVHDSLEDFAV